jgi:hypothetical protein
MNFRLPLFIFLFFSAFPFFSFAQQCGWSGYQVFVLDIRSETNNKAIEGLKVTLVDEEGNPYLRNWYKTDFQDNITEKWSESLNFWENQKKDYRHQKCTPPVNYMFDRLGRNYVAIIHRESPELKRKKPYWIKVEDVDGHSNGGTFPTAFFRLDFQHSISMCLLTSSHRTLLAENNDTFQPIAIRLKKEEQNQKTIPQKIVGEKFEAGPFQCIHQVRFHSEVPDLYSEDVWLIRDAQTLETKQIIALKHAVSAPEYMKTQLFKTGDFRFNGSLGIALLREWEKDPFKGPDRTRYAYYSYDSAQQMFVEDHTLSAVFNVEFDATKKQITQKIRKQEDGYQTLEVLVLGRYNQWNRVSYEQIRPPRNLTPNPYPAYEKTTGCALWLKGASDPVPVIDFNSAHQTTKTISDTFWLLNTCTQPIRLTGTTQGTFVFPEKISALDTGFVIFRELVRNPGQNATLQERYIILSVNQKENISLTLRYAVAGSETSKQYRPDRTLQYADFPSHYAGYVKRLETDSLGNAKELGLVRISNGKKAGTRMVRDANRSFYNKSVSKLIRLGIEGDTLINPQLLRISVHENGQWVVPETEYDPQTRLWSFWMVNRSDSIWVSAGTESNLIVLKYDELQEEAQFAIYLIASGALYITSPWGRIPISVSKEQFAMIWDYEWLYKHYGQEHVPKESVLLDHLFKDLKITPPMYIVFSGGRENKLGLDLSTYTEKQRSDILRKLNNQPSIQKVASVMYLGNGATTYSNGGVSIMMNYRLRNEQIPEIVNRFGFKLTNGGNMGGLVTAQYTGKFIDEDFIRGMLALSAHIDILSISMHNYMPVTLDEETR